MDTHFSHIKQLVTHNIHSSDSTTQDTTELPHAHSKLKFLGPRPTATASAGPKKVVIDLLSDRPTITIWSTS